MEAVSISATKYKGKGKDAEVTSDTIPVPFNVVVGIKGTADLLCHRWDTEAVASKAKAQKGSKEKKTDNVESYVYRLENGECGMPGLNFKAAICRTAKSFQDPRSPRKSAWELFRAGIRVLNDASFGKDTWDYLDTRRVVVQSNAVPRVRPAFKAGWVLKYEIEVLLPEYITEELLSKVVTLAGKLSGLGDYRPDFGTFMITEFKIRELK